MILDSLISSFEATLPETLVDQAVAYLPPVLSWKRSIQINSVSSDSEALKALQDENIPLQSLQNMNQLLLQMCQDLGIDRL